MGYSSICPIETLLLCLQGYINVQAHQSAFWTPFGDIPDNSTNFDVKIIWEVVSLDLWLFSSMRLKLIFMFIVGVVAVNHRNSFLFDCCHQFSVISVSLCA